MNSAFKHTASTNGIHQITDNFFPGSHSTPRREQKPAQQIHTRQTEIFFKSQELTTRPHHNLLTLQFFVISNDINSNHQYYAMPHTANNAGTAPKFFQQSFVNTTPKVQFFF